MVALAVLGIVIGISLAYLEAKAKSKFRMKLLEEFESHPDNKAAEQHMAGIVRRKAQWVKSLSIVRKPFSKEINMAVETAALLLALLALVSSIFNFDQHFSSPTQGIAAVIFLGVISGYIPLDWSFSGKLDKDIEGVMDELEGAIEKGELKVYMKKARKSWK